jgi:hypothetical protein
MMGAVAIEVAKESPEKGQKSLVCKPSQLPIYSKFDRWLNLLKLVSEVISTNFVSF